MASKLEVGSDMLQTELTICKAIGIGLTLKTNTNNKSYSFTCKSRSIEGLIADTKNKLQFLERHATTTFKTLTVHVSVPAVMISAST